MKYYTITMPIAGTIVKEVIARNKEEALAKFYEEGYDENSDELTWDMYEKIASGNVLHIYNNEVEIEEGEEGEEEIKK